MSNVVKFISISQALKNNYHQRKQNIFEKKGAGYENILKKWTLISKQTIKKSNLRDVKY